MITWLKNLLQASARIGKMARDHRSQGRGSDRIDENGETEQMQIWCWRVCQGYIYFLIAPAIFPVVEFVPSAESLACDRRCNLIMGALIASVYRKGKQPTMCTVFIRPWFRVTGSRLNPLSIQVTKRIYVVAMSCAEAMTGIPRHFTHPQTSHTQL